MSPVGGDRELAGPIKIDGLGQKYARTGEGHIAGIVIEAEWIFHPAQAYPKLVAFLRKECVINETIIEPDVARAAVACPARQPLHGKLQSGQRPHRGVQAQFPEVEASAIRAAVSKNIIPGALQPGLACKA